MKLCGSPYRFAYDAYLYRYHGESLVRIPCEAPARWSEQNHASRLFFPKWYSRCFLMEPQGAPKITVRLGAGSTLALLKNLCP
jgi:hypothetical protein